MQTTAVPASAETRKSPPMVRVDLELLSGLDAWAAELNARPETVGTITRSDVLRAIVAHRLHAKKPGEIP